MSQRKPRSLRAARLVRVQVSVREDDAELIRSVARALTNPAQAAEARALLRKRFVAAEATDLKALLVAAPLDGIDLTRER